MGAKPKAQTVGFRYFFDIHFTLGKKIDELCAPGQAEKPRERIDHY
ncbi:hypothetical protein P4054_29145 [Pseudomonas aeruginosa]|nr:hypothetical protein [Pseudomonas aeruginosa]